MPVVGTVCYATDQGLAMLAKSFHAAGMIQRVVVFRHRSYANHPEWYPDAPVVSRVPVAGPEVDAALRDVDVMLFFETPFDWTLPDRCRARGIKTVLMPMYEWSLRRPPHVFDRYLCPSPLDCDYFPSQPFVVPPVDPSTWRCRTRALHFVHNAGHIGHRNHKGTEELLLATPLLRPEIKLTIRSQSGRLVELAKRVPGRVRADVTVAPGDVPYAELFREGDVYVAPEKFNGLSLPLQEACAAGMMVMTTDRYPANTWLPQGPLLPVHSYHNACIGTQYMSFQEAEVRPEDIAEAMNSWWGRDITECSLAGREWAELHSWEAQRDYVWRMLTEW